MWIKKEAIIVISICIFLNVSDVFAQYKSLKRTDIEFHVGAAFPIGAFGSKAFSTDNGVGYNGAKIGVSYGLALDFYVINEYLGIMLLFNGHNYGVQDENIFRAGGDGNLANIYNSDWAKVENDNWIQFSAIGGLAFRYPLTYWFLVTARAGIGYAHILSPFYQSETNFNNKHYTAYYHSVSESSFGYIAGLGLQFAISRSFKLNIKGDYFGAVPFKFDNVKTETIYNNTTTGEQVAVNESISSYKQKFNTINLTFGFTVAF